MNKIDEIFELETWEERINLIKRSRRTELPNIKELKDSWYPERHRVDDKHMCSAR